MVNVFGIFMGILLSFYFYLQISLYHFSSENPYIVHSQDSKDSKDFELFFFDKKVFCNVKWAKTNAFCDGQDEANKSAESIPTYRILSFEVWYVGSIGLIKNKANKALGFYLHLVYFMSHNILRKVLRF